MTLHLPTTLKKFAGFQTEFEVPASTVMEALLSLIERHPDLKRHLLDSHSEVRPFVTVFAGEKHVLGAELHAPLREGEHVWIQISLAGG